MSTTIVTPQAHNVNSPSAIAEQSPVDQFARLAAAGLAYTLCIRWQDHSRDTDRSIVAGKAPIEPGWQHHRHTAGEARAHYASGGNVGIHLGLQPDGSYLYAFDADSAAARLFAVYPEGRQSLANWREGGSAKVFFRTDTKLPKRAFDPGGEHTKLELLVSGQAVIAGRHHSGQQLHCNFLQPLFLSEEAVKSIWHEWTGQEFDQVDAAPRAPARNYQPADVDDALIASAVRALKSSRADDYTGWRDVGFALKDWDGPGALELFHEFSGKSAKYDAKAVDRAWSKFRGKGITIASLIRWAIDDAGKDALAWPERTTTEEAVTANPTSDPEVWGRYTQLRALHNYADTAACLVTLRAALENAALSPRGAYTVHRVWLRLTKLARANVTYTLSKDVSTRRLAEHTAMSNCSVKTALDRLQEIGWLTRTQTDDGSLTVTLTPSTNLTLVAIELPVKDTDSYLSASLGDDLFSATPALVHALGRRTDDYAAGLVKALEYEALTPAKAAALYGMLPTLGPAARYLVCALKGAGSLTAKQAIAVSGLTRSAAYTAAHRLFALGLLEVNERRLSLVGDFDAKIDALRPKTRTYGSTPRRIELHSRERSSHLQALLAKADKAETKRILRLQAARDRYESEAGQLRAWLDLAGLKPARGAPWEAMKYERKNALEPDLDALAQQLKKVGGTPFVAAMEHAEAAGYSWSEGYEAWRLTQLRSQSKWSTGGQYVGVAA